METNIKGLYACGDCTGGLLQISKAVYEGAIAGIQTSKYLKWEVYKMSVLKITKENYETEVLKSDKLVLIDFYADWCGPCKMMSPIIDEIAEEVGDKIKVGKINVDENQELAMEYEVMSIPTIIILQNGEVKIALLV